MRIYTTYTPSHEGLYKNYFLKTLPKDDGLELVVRENPQECASGNFYEPGWNQTCFRKIEYFIEACLDNMGEVFAFSDVDIQFFGPIRQRLIDELGDYDYAAQFDAPDNYSSGFFVCRANERTLAMFQAMRDNYELEDQTTLNRFLWMCKHKFLSGRFFTVAHSTGGGWLGEDFEVPSDILVHHGNWVIGIDTKYRILDYVRSVHDRRYQNTLYENFSAWVKEPTYPDYPPYHEGPYLEDYLIERFRGLPGIGGRFFIPVTWTTCYVQGQTAGLQEALDRLDPNKSYFVVAQHDDAIIERLPADTRVFLSSGRNGGGEPVPLICSPIPFGGEDRERDVFCSFVGSMTHEIRHRLYDLYGGNQRFVFRCKGWTPTVAEDELSSFTEITSRSVFCLAPRGYGRASFRFFEALQLGSIPVFVYDEPWFPFEESLDYESFSVRVHVSEIENLERILDSIKQEDIARMQSSLKKVWLENFTMDSTHRMISEMLSNEQMYGN